MKRVFVAMLALMLAVSAQAVTNPTDAFKGRWQDEQLADAEMKILPQYLEDEAEDDLAVYPIDFYWNASDGRRMVWTMTGRYSFKTGRLTYSDGTKIEDGDILWTDGQGQLKLDASGRLLWQDSRDTQSMKLSFIRALSPAPTVDEFADGYFRVVAGLERGGSGAALKAARTIVKVLEFAKEKDLWNADGEAMQANLEAAWDSLTDGERARFDAVFDDGVSDPADAAFEDYAALKRVFEDAGVGLEMARLAANPEVRLSWEFLSSATLNMGNLEDGEYEEAEG